MEVLFLRKTDNYYCIDSKENLNGSLGNPNVQLSVYRINITRINSKLEITFTYVLMELVHTVEYRQFIMKILL